MRTFKDIKYLPLRAKRNTFDQRVTTMDWVLFALLFIYGLIIIYPFYNAFLISISPDKVYNETPFLFFPKQVTWDHYRTVFTGTNGEKLMSGLKVTLVLLFVGTLYQLFFTVITGYALSRNKWLGKNFVMNMILVTMFFGGGIIPYFQLISKLGLYDTFGVLIIPGAIDTYNMLLMRNYFASLPPDLEESAKIDGANDIQIFFKVYLPMSLPMLATIGLFFAVGNWNSWYNTMLFTENPDYKTLQYALREVIRNGSSQDESNQQAVISEGFKMASVFFTIIPMMCFYPFLQRFFVKGLVVGAIKG